MPMAANHSSRDRKAERAAVGLLRVKYFKPVHLFEAVTVAWYGGGREGYCVNDFKPGHL